MESIFKKIQRRDFSEPDRNQVQEMAIKAVQEYPQEFFERYETLKNDSGKNKTFEGRYICADMFKECFALFNRSAEDANRYNASIHNAAAVLAAEQFTKMLEPEKREPGRDTVIFLTGIPGAGKTSSCMMNRQLPADCHMIFEGQLARPEPSILKIKQVLDAGFKARIMVVHAKPEDALDRTFKRFESEGRGATISLMADLQANLPNGLQVIHERFGEQAAIDISDIRSTPKRITGWENLNLLKSEGSCEQIKERLVVRLEEHKTRGTVTQACYDQAYGRFTYERSAPINYRSMDRQHNSQNARDQRKSGEIGRSVAQISAPLSSVNAAGAELENSQSKLSMELNQSQPLYAARQDNRLAAQSKLTHKQQSLLAAQKDLKEIRSTVPERRQPLATERKR